MKHKCLKCQYSWNSFLTKPKSCPNCKSYLWFKPLKSQSHNSSPNSNTFNNKNIKEDNDLTTIKGDCGTDVNDLDEYIEKEVDGK